MTTCFPKLKAPFPLLVLELRRVGYKFAMELGCMWMRRFLLRPNSLSLGAPWPSMVSSFRSLTYQNPNFHVFYKRQAYFFHFVLSNNDRSLSTVVASSSPGPLVSFDEDFSDTVCADSSSRIGISRKECKLLLKGMSYTELEVRCFMNSVFVLKIFCKILLFISSNGGGVFCLEEMGSITWVQAWSGSNAVETPIWGQFLGAQQ